MTHSRTAVCLLSVFGTLAGCAPGRADESAGGAPGPSVASDPPRESARVTPVDGAAVVKDPLITRGLAVYRQHYCGLCHRLDRAETGGTFGPSHNGFATIAAQRIQADDYAGSATSVADYIRESILDPDVYVVAGYEATRFRMPAYANLAPEELASLVELLLSEK